MSALASSKGEEPVKISVVVPVRNRRDLLELLLDALEKQTRRDFEVIVVDDGSSDGADKLAASRTVAGRAVRLLRAESTGAVSARTIGAAESVGEILAFTDSDCAPEPQWLAEGSSAIESGADLANGYTYPARAMNPMERSLASGREGLYPTANMFFSRRAFEATGGFESAERTLGFRHDRLIRGTGFGEDTILAWRMIRSGLRVEYVAEARVAHYVFPADLGEWLSRGWSTAAFPGLVAEVPELRTTIMRRWVLFGVRSRVPFYATAAAFPLRRKGLILAAVAWWAALRLKDMRGMPAPWSRKLPYLPLEMLLDAVMGSAMVVGSVRARTLVL